METRRHKEQGYALLFVFLLAAFVAITLYTEMPRVAFERQRELEQELIDRGEQYRRAIQLYFRQFRRYPPNLEALENTNNMRFLRRRYKDPMTGESEWRLIHVGPGGVLTDSLVRKSLQTEKLAGANQFITELQSIGAAGAGQGSTPAPLAAIAVRRAAEAASGTGGTMQAETPPSEGESGAGELQPGAMPPPGPQAPAGTPEQTGPPGPVPFLPLPPGAQPGQLEPGQPGVGGPAPVAPVVTPFPQPRPVGSEPGPGAMQPPVPVPGLPPPYTQPISPGGQVGTPGTSPVPVAGGVVSQPGSGPGPGMAPGPPGPNPAAELLRRILTSPNPRGLAALQQQGTPAQPGVSLQPGIAGVATKAEAEGIKVYNERTKYNEWEFIYDFSQDAGMVRQLTQGAPGQPGGPGQPAAAGQAPPPGPGQPLRPPGPEVAPPGFGLPPGPVPRSGPGRR
jgi:type II secretory pathway pseudopilin PulG